MTTSFSPRSDFLRVMTERGFIHQCTDFAGLDQAILERPICAYVGYDATADSLHIGSLISIMMLRWLQKCGGRPIVLMGGATTRVGDPADKDQQRPLLSEAEITANLAGIGRTFSTFLRFGDGGSGAVMVDNLDWLGGLKYLEFLREFGIHFSVNRMLAFDSVRLRLEREQPLSFLEFNYMLMQAVDFLELNRRFSCVLQMGGSDQWGNIVNGVELIRRMEGKSAFGLTTHLLATASGEKMGKSVGGAVWLSAERLSPWDYWQMWRNVEDADVGRFLKIFTELPLAEIARMEGLRGAEINEAKKVLANVATGLLHGEEAARAAAEGAKAAFEEGRLSAEIPTLVVEKTALMAGIPLANLAHEAGLAESRGAARRLAAGGGLRVNDIAEADGARLIGPGDLDDQGLIKLAAGRKRIVLVRPSE